MPTGFQIRDQIESDALFLLRRIMKANGRLLLTDEEFAEIEQSEMLALAESRGFLDIEHGSEWMTGVVLAITEAGREAIGAVRPDRYPETLFRRMLEYVKLRASP